jgi:steroid delta-isomerase-like uncharacterized protein
MSTEENKAIVRRFYSAFEANDQAALNELLAPDLVAYSHSGPGPQNREVHLEGIRGWNAAFSETRFAIEDQIAEGDQVATRTTMHAIHSQSEFLGVPPAGKQVSVSGTTIERIKDGKIVERRVTSDWWGLMQQLGLAPGS